jgi:hypothetical protein
MVVGARNRVHRCHVGVRGVDPGCAVIATVLFIVVLALAMFVMPLMARKLERESCRLPPDRFGWFHEHVDRERKEPKRGDE